MTADYRYEIRLCWSEEDHAFIVEMPELPGCAADGATHEEAIANARIVIGGWIDTAKTQGRTIPTPNPWRGPA